MLAPTNIGDRSPQDFWVCGDGAMLFTANYDNDITEPAEVWRVNDGAAEPYMRALDEGAEPEAYRISYLGENAVFSMKLVYDESYSSGAWYLWVRDFEGATIAKGALPFAFREDTDVNNATLFLGRGGGDDTRFIAEFCNMAFDTEGGRQLYYLVRYTFEDGELHETLLAYMITD